MKINVLKERLISMAPPEIYDWGPWQFPMLYKVNDILYLEFHQAEDSAKDYGKEKKKYQSFDLGKAWFETNEYGGYQLQNGSVIVPHVCKPFKVDDISLGNPLKTVVNYGISVDLYPIEQVSEDYRKWYFKIFDHGKWTVHQADVSVPGYLMTSIQGVFPQPFLWQMATDSEGNLYSPAYKMMHDQFKTTGYCHAIYLKSTDNGKSFNLISQIPYCPPYEQDDLSLKRYGFTEPNLCFIDKDTAYTLLRTTDGAGIGPLYIAWSHDGANTWSSPEYFDDLGVWPQSVLLENGVSIAGYGRPGLYIRTYHNNAWSDRIEIVTPTEYQQDTCSYCAIQPISENSALIVYSRFNYPDESGRKRKVMMCREIEIEV